MTPLFSIIIPVFNVKDYLVKCLDSVANQTYGDWECICVDDGSTDGSGKILDKYVERVNSSSCEFEREGGVGEENGKTSAVHLHLFSPLSFRVIHQKNGGVSAARNAALDLAKGEWVQFLDSDDSLELDFLAKLVAKIKEHPEADAIEHAAVYCYDDGRRVIGTSSGRLPPAVEITGDDVLADPYGVKYTNLARCSCYKIFRREILERHHLRFLEGVPISEDAIFATQFYVFAHKVLVAPDVAGYLRIFREGSALTTKLTAQRLWPQAKGLELLFGFWPQHRTKAFARRLCVGVISLFLLGHGTEAREDCIQLALDSQFLRSRGIPFLLVNGSWKNRIFALAYLFSPRWLKRKILARL